MAKKKSKIKKFLKGAAKAALIGGALYGGSKLLGRGVKGNVSKTAAGEDVNINVNPLRKFITKKTIDRTTPKYDEIFGGGVGFKKGGRTGKQFGGGLNRPVARPVGGVGAPVRPLAYKHGGKVKSMGVAKRGGGIAKR